MSAQPRRTRAVRVPRPDPLPLDLQTRLAGLPEPAREHLFARDIKRRGRIDYAWPAGGRAGGLAVEVEGGVWTAGRHTRPSGYLRDLEKYNELALRGWLLLRVTYDMIADGSALALILRALDALNLSHS